MYFDTPRDYLGGLYEQLLYGDQPLGWDIIGTQGDGARRDARDLPRLHRALVPADAAGRRGRREVRRRPARARRGARLGDLPADDDRAGSGAPRRERRRARDRAHEAVRPGARLHRRPQLPARASGPLRAPAARDGARRRDVVTPLHRGPRAPRSRVLRLRDEQQLHRRGLALLTGGRRHQPDRRRARDDRARAAPDRRRAGARRRAREGAQLREGTVRPRAREPARDDHVRAPARGARGERDGAERSAGGSRRRHGRRTSTGSRRT